MSITVRQIPSSAAVSKADRISLAWVLFGMLGTIFLLVLFNVVPDQLGVWASAEDPESYAPLLSSQFVEQALPQLNILWGLTLALFFVHLGLRRWYPGTRVADIALTIFSLTILGQLIGMEIIALDPQVASLDKPLVRVVADWLPVLQIIIKIGLIAALVGTAIDLIRKLVGLVRWAQAAFMPSPS